MAVSDKSVASEIHSMTIPETRIISVSFVNKLSSGELLTGTPTVAEETTSHLTITNAAVNTVALTISGVSVAVGQAVQFLVAASGATADTLYNVDVLCGTDATLAQTLNGEVRIRVRAT